MEFLQRVFLDNTFAVWLTAVGIGCALYLAFLAFQRIILHRIERLAERTQTELDDIVVAVLKRTKHFTFIIASLYSGAQALVMSPRWEQVSRTVVILAMLIQGAIWANAAVSSILAQTVQRRAESDVGGTTTLKALGYAFRFAIWSVFLLMVLDNLGVNVTSLVAGLGIGGIAVALAVQNILGDLLASLSIVLDKPFEVGDFIIAGDVLGVVERIGLKTTRIRSLSGEQIIISNNDLLGSRVRNYKRMMERRVVFSVGVTFQTTHEKLSRIPSMIREIIERQDGVRFDRAHFQKIGDSALLFEVVYYLLDPDYNRYMDIQQVINLEVMRRFELEGIAFAYPTHTVFLDGNATPSTPSDSRMREK